MAQAGDGSGKGGGKRNKGGSEQPFLSCLVMHALSKRLRVEAFAILCERVASPKEIADELGEDLSHVTYHVNVLQACGLISLDHTEPRRGAAEHHYRASTPALEEAARLARALLEVQSGTRRR